MQNLFGVEGLTARFICTRMHLSSKQWEAKLSHSRLLQRAGELTIIWFDLCSRLKGSFHLFVLYVGDWGPKETSIHRATFLKSPSISDDHFPKILLLPLV